MILESIQNYCNKQNFAGNTHIQCVPISWVKNYPEFAKDGHNFSQSIDLKLGKKWLVFPCVPETLDFRERERVGAHGPLDTPTISGFVPNDTPKIAGILNTAKANEWVVILYYKTGEAKVIGSPDYPARFSSSFTNRGSLNSGKGYDIEFYSEGDFKTFFLNELPDPEDIECLPSIVTNDATSPTYTSLSPAGSTLVLPKENVFVNNVLFKNKNSVEDVNVEVVDTNNNPVGVINGGKVVVNNLPCAPATVENSANPATYIDTVGSGSSLILPSEDITVNGSLLITKPSVEDYDVEVVDSNDTPVGVISGGKVVINDLPCAPPTPKAGIAYREPNMSSITNTSYTDYDAGWRLQNNAYVNVQPDNPLYYQDLDYNSADPYNTLLHNNIFGNKHRFTDTSGNYNIGISPPIFIDNLTGRIYSFSVLEYKFFGFDWEQALNHRSSSGYFLVSKDEVTSLVGNTFDGIYINNTGHLPINTEESFTCNTLETDITKFIAIGPKNLPTLAIDKSATSTKKGLLYVKLMHPIQNP